MTFLKEIEKYLILAVIFVLAACSGQDEPTPSTDSSKDESKVYLSMTIPFGYTNAFSRADDKHPEDPLDLEGIENMINLVKKDYVLYIYVINKENNSSQLVFYNFNSSYGEVEFSELYRGYVIADLDVKNWGIDPTESVTLRVVFMCNKLGLGGTSPQYDYPSNTNDISTYSKLVSENTGKSTRATCTRNDKWNPGKDTDSYLPMFGTMEVTIPSNALLISDRFSRVDLHILWMIRAVAKLEILDDINRAPGETYPLISNVTLNRIPNNGCLIPWNSMTGYVNGKQVETTSLPTNIESLTANPYDLSCVNNRTILEQTKDSEGNPVIGADNKPVTQSRTVDRIYYGYTFEIPENLMSSPVITITVQYSEDPIDIRNYTLSLAGYDNQTFNFGTDGVIRNHTYRISVSLSDENQTLSRGSEPTPIFRALNANDAIE